MDTDGLMVIDLQVGLETETQRLYRLEEVLQGVNKRIAYYREEKKPIIFIQHQDNNDLIPTSLAWQLFPELDARSEDIYSHKTHANAFFNTNLQYVLQSKKIHQFEICGAQAEFCVDTTIRVAHSLGYTLFMQRGLVTTANNHLLGAATIIQHHEQIWNNRFLTIF